MFIYELLILSGQTFHHWILVTTLQGHLCQLQGWVVAYSAECSETLFTSANGLYKTEKGMKHDWATNDSQVRLYSIYHVRPKNSQND